MGKEQQHRMTREEKEALASHLSHVRKLKAGVRRALALTSVVAASYVGAHFGLLGPEIAAKTAELSVGAAIYFAFFGIVE